MRVLSVSLPFHRPESWHMCPAYDRRAFEEKRQWLLS